MIEFLPFCHTYRWSFVNVSTINKEEFNCLTFKGSDLIVKKKTSVKVIWCVYVFQEWFLNGNIPWVVTKTEEKSLILWDTSGFKNLEYCGHEDLEKSGHEDLESSSEILMEIFCWRYRENLLLLLKNSKDGDTIYEANLGIIKS